ncbi:unnamed protein product [Peniophora sp. CBMAI 1063]|nr:unnamed protein product [Peniophora sp. CBMAI 1063]
MSSLYNPPDYDDIPPPAYHDGRAVERLPAYREGYLLRYHPYERYRPSLFQRLLFSPCGRDFDYPALFTTNDDNAGIQAIAGDSATGGASVNNVEDSNALIPLRSSGAQAAPSEASDTSHGVLISPTHVRKHAPSASRPAKRKRDFEGEGDFD